MKMIYKPGKYNVEADALSREVPIDEHLSQVRVVTDRRVTPVPLPQVTIVENKSHIPKNEHRLQLNNEEDIVDDMVFRRIHCHTQKPLITKL